MESWGPGEASGWYWTEKIGFEVPGVRPELLQPVGMEFTKDGKYLFVALGPANRVAVVDREVVTDVRHARRAPDRVDRLVLACLAKKPEDRPQNARQLAQSLVTIDGMTWGEEEAGRWWSQHHPQQALAPDAITL